MLRYYDTASPYTLGLPNDTIDAQHSHSVCGTMSHLVDVVCDYCDTQTMILLDIIMTFCRDVFACRRLGLAKGARQGPVGKQRTPANSAGPEQTFIDFGQRSLGERVSI